MLNLLDTDRRQLVSRITAAIVAIGLSAAARLYLTAGEPAENPLADQLENSKIYRRSLEMYGGKANLLGTELTRWFQGLWHGKSLAATVAIISLAVAFLFHFFASPEEK